MTSHVDKHDAKRAQLPGKKFGRRAGVAAMGVLTMVVATGCSLAEWQRGGMPEPVTEQAPITLSFWTGSWIALLAVGFFVWGIMFWAFFAYRRRKNSDVPVQTRYNMPIEALWTVAPLILVVGIFYFAARDEVEITQVRNDQTQTVNVVGFRWAWTFNYVEENVYDTGQPAYRPDSPQGSGRQNVPPGDNSAASTLWLPVNEKVQFQLTSPDVIHSFWVPNFLYKLDVVPGRTNVFEVTPNKLGTFAGRCAELCGVDHSRMLFQLKVVTQEEFDAHVTDLRERGQEGQLNTGRTTNNAQIVG
ncbi:MAG: cytochrome c oxidase subunit 2 [Actinomycetes bacterium]|jgi:cytochrome c oxidase subunit 2